MLRVLAFPGAVWADLVDPRRVFGFFTLVAACDVLGVQLHLRSHDHAALVLWLVALSAWLALGYWSFAVLTFDDSQTGADVVHGGWLIAIVATESLVLLGAPLAGRFGSLEDTIFVAVYALWGIGIVLYGIFVTLFAYRIFFLSVDAEEMNPLFWVVMGAAAIATNAGSTLILTEPDLDFLLAMRPFVNGTTLILWAWATWLDPAARDLRRLAARHPPLSARVRADVLEPRLPARDVCGRDVSALARLGLPPDRAVLRGHGLVCPRGLARDDGGAPALVGRAASCPYRRAGFFFGFFAGFLRNALAGVTPSQARFSATTRVTFVRYVPIDAGLVKVM